jgi:uncharacterized protein (DUF433 family)
MEQPNPYLGIGLYTVPEAARLIGARPGTLHRWLDGYTWHYRGDARRSGPLFRRDYEELVAEGLLTFADLIELKLIAMFKEEGFSLQLIREIAHKAADEFQVSHPFAIQGFHTDGTRIIMQFRDLRKMGKQGGLFREMPGHQLVFGEIAKQFFRKLDYTNDHLAAQYWPLGKTRGVVLDPQRCLGKPIIAKSGVPTWALYSMATGASSTADVAKWYGVSERAVERAVEFERSAGKPH